MLVGGFEFEREPRVRIRGVVVHLVSSLKRWGRTIVRSLARRLAGVYVLVSVQPGSAAQGLKESRVCLSTDFLLGPHLQEVESQLDVRVSEGALPALGS